MVIDTHIHPALFAPICGDDARFQARCDEMNYHLMKPSPLELLKKQYALADIQRVVLLPEDCSCETDVPAISNDDIARLTALEPELFLGLASADPRCGNAAEELDRKSTRLNSSHS